MKRTQGFTLIELMFTITVLAVLLTIAVPSMFTFFEKRRTISAAEEIYSQLQLARSAAIARSQAVYFNISTGANWAIGVSDDPGCDPSDNDPPCTLPDVDDANAITHLITSASHATVSLDADVGSITFSPQRGTATQATIDITSTGTVGYVMAVEVGVLGQISMCSPDDDPNTHVAGYRAC